MGSSMNPIQIAVLALGALFAVAGIMLFARRGTSGKNSIKIAGMEFQLAGSSLVVFVLGVGLVVVAAKLETKPAPDSAPKEVAKSPAPAPPRDFKAQVPYRADMIERIEFQTDPNQVRGEKVDEFLQVTEVVYGTDAERRQI